MKNISILFIALCTAVAASAQPTKPAKVKLETLPSAPLRTKNNNAFKAGEVVTYRIHYGMINAGEAKISVHESPYKFGDREAFHVVGEGWSLGSFDWFFRVRDRFETYIDKSGLFPYRFIRNCDEGGYKINQDYTFFPDKRAYKDMKGEAYLTPEFVQDMISSYFYTRTLDFDAMKPGDIITVMTLVDDEIYPMKMKYIGKDKIKVDVGTFRCLKFAPVVQKGRIFKKEEDLSVWITDDGNHIPILARAKILVGSIKMELKTYAGLSHQISQVFE